MGLKTMEMGSTKGNLASRSQDGVYQGERGHEGHGMGTTKGNGA